MKRFVILLAAGMLVGCESAVLVNNRPEREPDWNATDTPTEPQQASAKLSADMDDADRSPTTRPADQKVQTEDVRIESNSY